AVASRRRDGSARPSVFTDTFEPGSVAKIFTAAALLALQRVARAERVSGEDGKYRLGGRTITDEEPLPVLTLADAIRFSSNIALVKFAARLAPAEQYAMLRDVGFGAFTGIDFAAEAAVVNVPVAAKTGTARRVVGGRYAPGQYTASFAALSPADRPQLVLVVKIDDPRKGSYFAAQTAAPVTRSMLEQALAARTVALDRARLSTAAPR